MYEHDDASDGRTDSTTRRRFLSAAAAGGAATGLLPFLGGARAQESDRPAFDRRMVEEHRGDVAEFTLSLSGADRARVVVGSEAMNYRLAFTAVDGSGDGEVTLALDTFLAGRSDAAAISAAPQSDEVRNVRQTTPALDSPLDFGSYPLEVRVDGRPVDQAVLVLHPRETNAAYAGIAPRNADPANQAEFLDATTQRGEVAEGDWAVLQFNASGIYAALDGGRAFVDESLGYELTLERTEVVNAEPERVPLEDLHLFVDEDDDRFLVAVDSARLQVDETYEAAFALTDAYSYVPEGERERVAVEFDIVERSATVLPEDEPLTVPQGEAAVSGASTVAPGTTLTVSVSGPRDRPFQRTAQTTVEADGTWSASFDFSDVEPGTTFEAQVLELSSVVEGEVVAPR